MCIYVCTGVYGYVWLCACVGVHAWVRPCMDIHVVYVRTSGVYTASSVCVCTVAFVFHVLIEVL